MDHNNHKNSINLYNTPNVSNRESNLEIYGFVNGKSSQYINFNDQLNSPNSNRDHQFVLTAYQSSTKLPSIK